MTILDGKPFDLIDEDDLLRLIEIPESEAKVIEYKRELSVRSDADKKEFLADVSSFANALGGHLIFGMEEENGVPTRLVGLDLPDPDAAILRLEDIIRSGLAPRIPGLMSRAIPLSTEDRVALVFRIPQSWQSPHMVRFGGRSHFYSRSSAGKYQLDIDEIRSAFVASETTKERIRDFRIDRVSKVITGDTPVPLFDGPKSVFHVLPLSTRTTSKPAALQDLLTQGAMPLRARLEPEFLPPYVRLNFDGVLTYGAANSPGPADWYLQLYRDGSAEFVTGVGVTGPTDISRHFEQALIDMFGKLLSIHAFIDIEPPIVVLLTIVGVRDYTIEREQARWLRKQVFPIERDILPASEIVFDHVPGGPAALRPMFDAVWNAAGWDASPNFRDDGSWTLRWGR